MDNKSKRRLGQFIISVILTLTGCNYADPELEKEYLIALNTFDKSLVDHFPKRVTYLYSTLYHSQDKIHSHPGIWFKTKIDGDKLDSLIQVYDKTSIAKYKPADSCLLVLESHLTDENWFKYDKSLRVSPKLDIPNRDCHTDKFPIPKFWSGGLFETKDTEVGLTNDYELYVLDSKAGLFMDADSLPNGKYTYKGWEHGFTKGVAVDKDDRLVIFWFDIW